MSSKRPNAVEAATGTDSSVGVNKKVKKSNLLATFKDESGETIGPPLDLPEDLSTDRLAILLNSILENEEDTPYSFFIGEEEVVTDVKSVVEKQGMSRETMIEIVYRPQAVFRVRPVSRCQASLIGHGEAVLSVQFSPDGKRLASGSGDTTVRFWDLNTNTPQTTAKGHTNWVLFISWSPDAKKLASGGMDNNIIVWDGASGKQKGSTLKGHKKFITCLSWEPFHLNPKCERFVSSSKDGTAKLWDSVRGKCIYTFAGHQQSVTCCVWSGEGLIYTGSQDRTIKVWNAEKGTLVRTLSGHAHWINTMALSSSYVLRTGAFDHYGCAPKDLKEAQQEALKRYKAIVKSPEDERLVSGSDDFTMYMWKAAHAKQSINRLTGHQQLINEVRFSPDGNLFASASFDKSIKLWDGRKGTFICTFRGHVAAVYQVAWSSDSRLLVSSSKDSTLKVWSAKTRKQMLELPGHADEVFSVDWSPNGERVVSGSKDKMLKVWSR